MFSRLLVPHAATAAAVSNSGRIAYGRAVILPRLLASTTTITPPPPSPLSSARPHLPLAQKASFVYPFVSCIARVPFNMVTRSKASASSAKASGGGDLTSLLKSPKDKASTKKGDTAANKKKKAAVAKAVSKPKKEKASEYPSAEDVAAIKIDVSSEAFQDQAANASLKDPKTCSGGANHIVSWNVAGLRAIAKNKTSLAYLKAENADVICLQEIKCTEDQVPPIIKEVLGDTYPYIYWHPATHEKKKGQSGVGLLCKAKPLNVTYDFPSTTFPLEGRVVTAEFASYYLVNVYVPNSGSGLVNLESRCVWNEEFRTYIHTLDAEKPVILTGDLNVAHKDIDIKNAKSNWNKSPGFTQQECDGFSKLLAESDDGKCEGFVDMYRHLYPDVAHSYTYFSYRFNAFVKNLGWRLDYFVVSRRLADRVENVVPRKGVLGIGLLDGVFDADKKKILDRNGNVIKSEVWDPECKQPSDHCPLVLQLKDEIK